MAPLITGRIAEDYAQHFRYLEFGQALYHPKSNKVMKPGMLGYFDSLDEWSNVVDLGEEGALKNFNLSKPKFDLGDVTLEQRLWGEPLTSQSVSGHKIYGTASLQSAGLPVEAKLGYEFTLHEEFGAVLVTSAEVLRSRLKVFESSIKSWFEENLPTILSGEMGETFKEFGLCVIMGTYSVKKFSLDAWRGKGETTHCGLGARASSVGGLAAGGQVYHGHTVGGWISGTAKSDDRLIVFASGLRFRFRRSFRKGSKATSEPLRSADEISDMKMEVTLRESDEVVEIDVEDFGGTTGDKENEDEDELGARQEEGPW